MSYLFNDLHFTSETNTRSLDFLDKQDVFDREHQGLAPDGWRLTQAARNKKRLCVLVR